MNRIGIGSSAIALGSVLVAFGGGVGAGYLIFKKRFEDQMNEEIDAFKADYGQRMEAQIENIRLAKQNADAKDIATNLVDELKYNTTAKDEKPEPIVDEAPVVTNVFDENPRVPDWDQAAAEAQRKTDAIYILSREEFFANEFEFEERQFSYYEGDDQLVNEQDQVVTDVVQHIGVDCLSKFGYGSENEDIVYVQNESKRCIYEITRTDGKYSEIVLGLEMEEASLQHSAPRRFRSYHDE